MPDYGLIGNPLGHTFSKKYFTEKFRNENKEGFHYENYELNDISEITGIIESNPGLHGLNVTIPFKEQVIKYLADYNPIVASCKACNCIRIEEGTLYGYNTDIFGFVNSFIKLLLPQDMNALVLGTGGASKAVCVGLNNLGIQYLQISRKENTVTKTYQDITAETLSKYTVIINTTPLGSGTKAHQLPDLPYELITDKHYLFDVGYNPTCSLFLEEGRRRNARVMNGEEMLILQAEESWRIWTAPFEFNK